MRFSLQIHYAICGVFDLAYNGDGSPVQVRVIGDRQQIPARYLEQIFQRLRRAELVSGKRGPGGGYVLARSAQNISLRDIVEAIEGPIGAGRAGESGEKSRYRPDFLWGDLAQQFSSTLAAVSLDDLCRRAARAGVPRWNFEAHTYVI